MTDRGPTAVARFQVHAVHLTNMILQQRYIVFMELFHGLVPAWRMLHSSASALEHNQNIEHFLSNHMPSDCLVLGSHSDVSTVTVEESYPTPHIHEQKTTSNYGYDTAYNFTHNNIMLEPNAMNNIDTVAHMNMHNTQY